MGNSSTLHLLCGKMAAGKSTFAKELSQKHQIVVFSEDDLLAALYPGDVTDIASYVKLSNRVKLAIESIVVDLLAQGTSLVLDFPANTVAQRAWLVGLAKQSNSQHILHFLDTPESTCKAQLEKRATEQPERAATDTVEMFDAISQYFEAPTVEEDLNLTVYQS